MVMRALFKFWSIRQPFFSACCATLITCKVIKFTRHIRHPAVLHAVERLDKPLGVMARGEECGDERMREDVGNCSGHCAL